MKKLIIAFMVIIVLAAVFAGCANNDQDREPTYTVVPTVTTRPAVTPMPDTVMPTPTAYYPNDGDLPSPPQATAIP